MVTADQFKDDYETDTGHQGVPYSEDETAKLVETFHREGWIHLGNILTPGEVDALKGAMIRKYDDRRLQDDEEGDHIRGPILMRMFEYHQSFRDLIEREPVVSLAESILGDDCHVMSQNAMRTALDYRQSRRCLHLPQPGMASRRPEPIRSCTLRRDHSLQPAVHRTTILSVSELPDAGPCLRRRR